MCMQCMATAMATGAAASGIRVWLAAHRPRWLTASRLKAATVVILAAAVVAAGISPAPKPPAQTAAASSQVVEAPPATTVAQR